MMNNGKLLGGALLAFSLGNFLLITDLFGFSDLTFAGIILALYGLIAVFFNLGWNKRGWLFLGNAAFFIGLSILINFYFDLKNNDSLFITIFFFALANGFLLLFIENIKEYSFLFIALAFFILSFLSEKIVSLTGNFSMLANLGWILLGYWPIFLILLGAAILSGRKK